MGSSTAELLRRAALYESWVKWSAFVVVFGVALEALEERHPRFLKPHLKSVLKSWKVIGLLFFLAPWMVAGGVLGEWWSGILVWGVQEQIRANADKEIARANLEAAMEKRRLAETQLKLIKLRNRILPRYVDFNVFKFAKEFYGDSSSFPHTLNFSVKTRKKERNNGLFFPRTMELSCHPNARIAYQSFYG